MNRNTSIREKIKQEIAAAAAENGNAADLTVHIHLSDDEVMDFLEHDDFDAHSFDLDLFTNELSLVCQPDGGNCGYEELRVCLDSRSDADIIDSIRNAAASGRDAGAWLRRLFDSCPDASAL